LVVTSTVGNFQAVAMPKLSPNSVTLLDGDVVLTRRDGSEKWQARFKMDGRWIRCSTKEKDLNKAKEVAKDRYLDAHYRVKHGVPAQSKRFKDVAKLAIDRMQKAVDSGEGKKVFRDYIQATNNYLIPFFGNRHVDSITYQVIKEFTEWRSNQTTRAPKASTYSTYNSALNRIFDEALMHRYIAKTQIPVLENKGQQSQRRPDFTLDEYRKIYRGLRGWIKQGRNGKSTEMRLLLRDYVLILANTGMRHGTEAQNLRWKHVGTMTADGRQFVTMWVKGKTKARELVARYGIRVYLKRIHQRCTDIGDITFDELLASKSELPVFRLSDGTVTDNLAQTFRVFLQETGLITDPMTGQERTLYSLRHMYATFQIAIYGVDIHLLAKQMGTSIQMIEKHYSHLTPRMNAHKLAGR
jgi:integrase